MKRLVRKSNKFDSYNSIINTLMNNDHNATWNEIYTDHIENYNEDEALNKSIEEAIEALEISLSEDLDKEDDLELFNFYTEQLNKLKSL